MWIETYVQVQWICWLDSLDYTFTLLNRYQSHWYNWGCPLFPSFDMKALISEMNCYLEEHSALEVCFLNFLIDRAASESDGLHLFFPYKSLFLFVEDLFFLPNRNWLLQSMWEFEIVKISVVIWCMIFHLTEVILEKGNQKLQSRTSEL